MPMPSTDRAAAGQVIRGLIDAGWELDWVFDGGEDVPVTTVTQALHVIFSVDTSHLYVKKKTGETGWVWFVLGNEPDEVAADYTVNLSEAIDPITERWWR